MKFLQTVESGPTSVPKRVSTTRWSCPFDAVKALVQGYLPIRETLAKIARHENETSKARSVVSMTGCANWILASMLGFFT